MLLLLTEKRLFKFPQNLSILKRNLNEKKKERLEGSEIESRGNSVATEDIIAASGQVSSHSSP